MLKSFPAAWLLLALPFFSCAAISTTPKLRVMASRHTWITWPLGVAGLIGLLGALVGFVPAPAAVPVALLGGAVAGYACFWAPAPGSDGEDGGWGRSGPPPEEPPPPRPTGDRFDWDEFDSVRACWERLPALHA